MRNIGHKVFIYTMIFIAVTAFFSLAVYGADYYSTHLHDRFYHSQNELLSPSGMIGHGLGVTGSFFMLFGVFSYMARKRIRMFSRVGILKHWLEFHIFLCTLGPVLVLYHTSFKFGGLVAISFWSMVAVVCSGVIGRFIYLQIPRTIEGREMNLIELSRIRSEIFREIEKKLKSGTEIIPFLDEALEVYSPLEKGGFFKQIRPQLKQEKNLLTKISKKLKTEHISPKEYKTVMKMVRGEILINRRIAWLSTMQDYLRYWHVVHLPFALVMLVIMIVHVIVALVFGYRWIF